MLTAEQLATVCNDDGVARSWTAAEMDGVGHFPMSEDPERLRDHLLPILEQVRTAA